VALESRTQGPRELERVSLVKEIPVCTTDAVEPILFKGKNIQTK